MKKYKNHYYKVISDSGWVKKEGDITELSRVRFISTTKEKPIKNGLKFFLACIGFSILFWIVGSIFL